VREHDHLRRVCSAIEDMHRVVFYGYREADWTRAGASAEQILIAELVSRHQGNPDGVFFALRALEDGGKTWDEAIRELAAAIHSYFTTPLGIILRQDLFGDAAVFMLPAAKEWAAELRPQHHERTGKK